MFGETHQTIADILSRPLLFRYLSVSCNDNQLAQTEQGQCLFCDLKYVDIVGEPVLPAHGVHPDRSRRLVTGVHLTLLRHCLRPRPRPHLRPGQAEDGRALPRPGGSHTYDTTLRLRLTEIFSESFNYFSIL